MPLLASMPPRFVPLCRLQWKQVQQSPSSIRFPDGETLREVQERAVAALHEMSARHPRGTVAAVTHADVIRLVLAHFAGVHLDLFQRLIVSPASVSVVGLGDRICVAAVCVDPTEREKAPPPAPKAAPPDPGPPKCERTIDCEEGICIDGRCRH